MMSGQQQKKVVEVPKCNKSKIILELLQKNGFIYGFSKLSFSKNKYSVFLKYSKTNEFLLKRLYYFKKPISQRDISKIEDNSMYLILNKSGYILENNLKKPYLTGLIVIKIN